MRLWLIVSLFFPGKAGVWRHPSESGPYSQRRRGSQWLQCYWGRHRSRDCGGWKTNEYRYAPIDQIKIIIQSSFDINCGGKMCKKSDSGQCIFVEKTSDAVITAGMLSKLWIFQKYNLSGIFHRVTLLERTRIQHMMKVHATPFMEPGM